MNEMLARFFRWSNSKLITSDNIVLEKILKVFFYLSLRVYRRAKPKTLGTSSPFIIHNFDTTLSLHIDRSRAMGAALYWTGFHEFREFLFLHRYLKPDMVFIDVGANLGEYSLFAAKRLSNGEVLAFEPLPSIRKVLEYNISLNGFRNIEVYPFGLSAAEGSMVFHEFQDVHEGLATLYPGDRRSALAMEVKLKRLDDVVSARNLSRIDFVKIDIEGGELKALQGGTSVIKNYRPVFMIEINSETYRTAGYTVDDVSAFFKQYSYQSYTIKKRGLIEKMMTLPAFGNILFMPQ